MDFNAMLKVVKAQNPDMPYKEQQQKAKVMFAEFKAAQKALSGEDLSHATKPEVPAGDIYPKYDPNAKPVRKITMSELVDIEKRIRAKIHDKNSIISIARELMPDGHLETHGKDGVNTLVTFEDDYGNKVPIVGCFRIFL